MIKNYIKNLIILQSAFGAGNSTSVNIYKKLKSNNLLDTSMSEIIKSRIIPDKYANKINNISDKEVLKILNDCYVNKIKVITINDYKYPERLRNIPVPPLVLYIKGELPDFDKLPTVTIVGPRIERVSDFGKKAAYSLAMRLSRAGFIVVSGAATGCDTFAHIGSLRYGFRTVGVLGCGILYDYLPENRPLRNKICEKGCLISEYPPFTPTTKFSFPIRNRILAGLSLGTIIIEAGKKSGALNTARHAYEQGRDVFVIPGNPTDKNYKGSNELLRDGATPLLDVSDIFNLYIKDFSEFINVKKAFEPVLDDNNKKISKKSIQGLSNEAKIVYNNLNNQKFTADDLINIGISDDEIISALTELEIEHLIKSFPGGMYEII